MKNLVSIVLSLYFGVVQNVILAPPWADPRRNPCASLPRGWQMLFWEPDGECYPIFQMGYPCPPTMELTPVNNDGRNLAECRCPPGTAALADDKTCHQLFTRGPCQQGEYFAPLRENNKTPKSNRLGVCKKPKLCKDKTKVFSPQEKKCYRKFTKGPCFAGSLVQGESGVANCACDKDGEMSQHYSPADKGCFEHFTRGPCPNKGDLFLPGGVCGCYPDMPQYHNDTKMCYEIGSIGPCSRGHRYVFQGSSNPLKADCSCKPNYVYWKPEDSCYRAYTQGPCSKGKIIVEGGSCKTIPCDKGHLYFPEFQQCFKTGMRGPCDDDKVVIFDFKARPSIDGLAYNGVCGCKKALTELEPSCIKNDDAADDICEENDGTVEIGGNCHVLYTNGPCSDGQWLVPKNNEDSDGVCDCKPGYRPQDKEGNLKCIPPLVALATFLNNQQWN